MRVFLLFLLSFSTLANSPVQKSHLYIGAGELYGLASIRFGGASWEAGLLNRGLIGVAKTFHKEKFYAQGGVGLTINNGIGFLGSMGLEYGFWKVMGFRIETNIAHGLDNYASAELQLGLSAGW
jgi:hypothetical protein